MRTRKLILASLIATTAGLAACSNTPSGSLKSEDKFTYASVPFSPKTVEIVDIRTEEVVWARDIPVGWNLTIDFGEDAVGASGLASAPMKWTLTPETVSGLEEKGTDEMPPRGSRRVEMSLREAPEYPQAAAASTEG